MALNEHSDEMIKPINVSILNVRVGEWRRFRAYAVLNGLNVQEALYEAIKTWTDKQEESNALKAGS